MNKIYFSIVLVALTQTLIAQSEYDCVDRKKILIVKTGSESKSLSLSKVSELRSISTAEQQFGKNYKYEKKYTETEDAYFNVVTYDDGLELRLPENPNLDNSFHIRTDKYTMLLSDGQVVRVGMKADELKTIFPKSYLKRAINENIKGREGKPGLIVYFSTIIKNRLMIEDSWIVFVLSKEGGVLEEFYTWTPS